MSKHTSHEVFDGIEFTKYEGDDCGHDLTVYSLSTCAFCRKAIGFLREEGVAFRVLELDKIPTQRKRDIKRFLKEKFEDLPVFPVLVVDDEECVAGYAEDAWRRRIER